MSHPEDFKQPFPTGEINTTYAQFFTGTSYLAPLAVRDAAVVNVAATFFRKKSYSPLFTKRFSKKWL